MELGNQVSWKTCGGRAMGPDGGLMGTRQTGLREEALGPFRLFF